VRAAALLVFLAVPLHGQAKYQIAPPASWVKPLSAELTAPPAQGNVTGGYEMLLVDRQERIGPSGLERFKHISYRLLDEGAVQDNSQLEFVVDPTYEHLTLHAVTVTRKGRVIDQLKPDRIRVVKRESEMDYQIFDGSLSVVLVLEDVHRGDVIDYSYSKQGANPVFAGHYAGEVSLQETVPVRRLSFRLLWPRERELFIRRYNTRLEPVITDGGSYREYVWSARDLAPLLLDTDLPDWFNPFPAVQLSDFPSWSAVAAWGDTLFAADEPVPQALEPRLARIHAASPVKADQVRAALRFVQDEVRYLGVEIGINSHVPHPAALVIRRGYGDCKDKVQLLITMLRALGVPARPALVSTTYGAHVRDLEPTASLFDHVIARVDVDGRIYWLDPTVLHQRGELSTSAPLFGAALVLGAGDSLASIPVPPAAEPVTDVAVSFELGGVGAPATMRVETSYRGRVADDIRDRTRATSPQKLQREYTDYYSEGYPGIQSEAVPAVNDDEAANVIHTSERYSIPKFWHPSTSQQGFVGTFDPVELDRAIPSPGASARTMPLAVPHPVHYRYSITAHIESGWSIRERADTIVTPAMRFVRAIEVDDKYMTLRYEYLTLADHVEPSAAAEHLDQLSRVRRLLTFTITPPPSTTTAAGHSSPESEGTNWLIALLDLFAAVLAALGGIYVLRSSPPTWLRGSAGGAPGEGGGPVGLGGWLILVGFGVCIMPLTLAATLLKSTATYSTSSWAQLTVPTGVRYDPRWAPTLLLELIGNSVLLVFACVQVWLFFRRKRWFPALFVLIAGARIILDLTDLLLAKDIPSVQARGIEWSQHLATLAALILWVWYMFRSRRVRNTFIN
jgi:transglutaminase-like putative cysteine protease